jgi:anti-anti-sigma factor
MTRSPHEPLLTAGQAGKVTVTRLARPAVLSGELAEAVGEQLARLVDGPGGGRLAVDLGNVESLSSLMLAGLTALNKKVNAAGGRLVLFGPRPAVREILDVTHLTRLICVYDREGDALGSFA